MIREGFDRKRIAMVLHVLLAVLECIAAIYLLSKDGLRAFRYYTVDSNVMMLFVSGWYLVCFLRGKEAPKALTVAHLVAAVCLTVTFLIAAFVLMPQSTFYHYFVENVASINHFIGPVLSVVTLMLSDAKIPKHAVFAPVAVTLTYGVILLLLNAAKVVKGPYFFLEVYSTPVPTIVMWFGIIFILCTVLSAVYMWLHGKVTGQLK